MYVVYKIYSLNSDLFYLFSKPKQKYKSQILNKFVYDYKQYHYKNKKSKNDDLFIIIQKNNICIDEVIDYDNRYEADNYIYDIIQSESKCINDKQSEYIKNDITDIILGLERRVKKTNKEKNRLQYLKRKRKQLEEKENKTNNIF